ncbi:MAG: hypothetical protein ACTSY1_11925 [Alphaproteobacteria bacterium]
MTRPEKYQFQPLAPEVIAAMALAQVEAEPAPSWGEAQVEQIRAQAYADGMAQGQAAAQDTIETQRVAALRAIERQLGVVSGQFAELGSGLEKSAAALAYGIARIVAQDALKADSLAVIEPILARCLNEISSAPRLVIQVHDSLVDGLEKRLGEIVDAAGFAGRVQVAGGAAQPGDCRIEWPEGGMERQMSTILDDLENQYRAHGVVIEAELPARADPADEV